MGRRCCVSAVFLPFLSTRYVTEMVLHCISAPCIAAMALCAAGHIHISAPTGQCSCVIPDLPSAGSRNVTKPKPRLFPVCAWVKISALKEIQHGIKVVGEHCSVTL
ncbi:hypothetical protein C8R44DRAFT_758719 [Mycena epipterygia]|nr:hypothetical protein C8R44DRAFT_758719 [Mycena epipterygia]